MIFVLKELIDVCSAAVCGGVATASLTLSRRNQLGKKGPGNLFAIGSPVYVSGFKYRFI